MKKRTLAVSMLVILLCIVSKTKYNEVYIFVCTQYAPLILEMGDNLNEEFEQIVVVLKNTKDELPDLRLYAMSACLMDADSKRVIYSKNAYNEMPMASTTKIMTLLIALEYGNLKDIVTISSNAARQPDVQLNINTGEQYYLEDLLYSLMLESHNDTAVAIAEHIGGSVDEFCNMMTSKAKAIGAMHTSFKTPNGLDADGHYTTAADLALIGSYAIQNDEFNKITNTQIYEFVELTKERSLTVNNKDRFLQMMEGAIGIKTGFTSKAGYCFVGAIEQDGKRFVSVVLGSGWPPNKNYKWTDTTKLMNMGLDNFSKQTVFSSVDDLKKVKVYNGMIPYVSTKVSGSASLLLSDCDEVKVIYDIPDIIDAPINEGQQIGMASVYVNNEIFYTYPICVKADVSKIDIQYCIEQLFKWTL